MTVDFNDYFWGEKNNGFDVLYHNMKYGLVASKEMTDFFRERSNIEESNSKMMTKLANKAGSGCIHGTFAPVWAVLKGSAERLSSLHLQMVQKITELVKDITKYAEELHKKHKAVKEEEAGTLEAVQAMQASTHAVQKAKELYTSRMQEIEKMKKDNCSPKDLEKAETKLRKQHDDYRNLVEKHNPIKMEFERRMTSTCKRFQDIEEAHLKQMREFLTTYIELLQTNHDMVGQVHTEFKRQFVEMTVDKLLEQFVLNKYTGLEKPEIVELDLMNWPTSAANQSSSSTHNTPPTNTVNNTVTVAEVPPSGGAGTAVTATTGASGMGPTTPAPAPPKREINLRNWFTSSSSSSSAVAAAAASSSVSTASPSSASSGAAATTTAGGGGGGQNDQDGGSKEGGVQGGEAARGSPNASVVPSMRNTKSGRGKMIIGDSSLKAIGSRIRERAAQPVAEAQQAQEQQPQKTQQPKEKSSRRTTSLLNLFMSNSQGSRESRDSRDSPSIEVLSAPTSPTAETQFPPTTASNTQIGRNPLRGSKFSGFLRSRREKAKTKKVKKKKDSAETNSNKDEKISDNDEKEETVKSENSAAAAQVSKSPSLIAPTATPEVDEDGYSVQPSEPKWETLTNSEKGGFYSSSDSDSDDNERDRKIHVEIKPLNNGTAPISASVDELRATVENLSLSPLGGALSHHPQSPAASNASTPTTTHPYAPLQSPTLSASNSSNNKYADLGDVFSEIEDITTSAPPSATLTKLGRQIPTPTSTSSIAIPRPPSRRSEAAGRGRVSPSAVSTISRADSVGSLEFRTAGVGIGSSRGPSPLTIGISDTIPLAVAFHEMIHAYFRGSDESRCQVKMSGDMMLSFPAGIVGVFANNPNPAKLGFRIKNIQNLDNVIPNKQLVTIDKLQSTSFSTTLEFNMPALTALLRRQSEQNPTASYFNVDILKYQMRPKTGASSCPFQLVCYWKCEPTHTDIKIDYKYNSHAMAAPTPLLNISITVPVDGGVRNVQSKPHSAWLGESNRLVWNFTDISQHSDNNGVGTLRARLEVANGPSTPAILQTQFNCEGTTLSGIEFELTGPGYRLSLVKRRFVSGKYICEGDGIRSGATPTSPLVSSPNPYSKTG